jgi:hypothetical protein
VKKREREIQREGGREDREKEREGERGRKRQRELHASSKYSCEHAVSVPHSFSQSACVIIILIYVVEQQKIILN